MSAIVDYSYYSGTYLGTEADAASFPALNAHASRIVGAMTRWRVTESTIDDLPEQIQDLYRTAVCAQIDFLAINGVESVSAGTDGGFTVGKVSVQAGSRASAGGAMSANISPAAISYLEQTGLMNPQVPALDGWWP